ncbi:MAG: GH25 family lysozyme [Myxococcota bacterium]
MTPPVRMKLSPEDSRRLLAILGDDFSASTRSRRVSPWIGAVGLIAAAVTAVVLVQDSPPPSPASIMTLPSLAALRADCTEVPSAGSDLTGFAALRQEDELLGIDVSMYQGVIDWPRVAHAGAAFVFIRASEGTDIVDPCFGYNWQASAHVGLPRGAYHVFSPAGGADQARAFLDVVEKQGMAAELPMVVDLEPSLSTSVPPQQLTAELQAWLDVVYARTGRHPIIYGDVSMLAALDGYPEAFDHAPLWIAAYDVATVDLPAGWPPWTFWQLSDTGSINGITGPVDVDRFSGDRSAFNTFIHNP